MASKVFFVRGKDKPFIERSVQYQFNPGLSFSQKQKNVVSIHEAIQKKYGDKQRRILEVSSKSLNEDLGIQLSAFNLSYKYVSVETLFQASKCFNGAKKPDSSIMKMDSLQAKRAANTHGAVTSFLFEGHRFPTIPRSFCYDYIYCLALYNTDYIDKEELAKYNVFTDVEFNSDKQFNCQARSVCIFTYLYKHNLLEEALSSPENFRAIVYK